jgi:hypothetical protein
VCEVKRDDGIPAHGSYEIRYQVSYSVDNEIQVQNNNAGDRETAERIVDPRMRLQGNDDSNRPHRQRPRAFAVVVPTELVAVENSAISEGEEFTDTAGRIPSTEEEVLGSAFVGEGLFLRNDRSDLAGDDKRVYRRPCGTIR